MRAALSSVVVLASWGAAAITGAAVLALPVSLAIGVEGWSSTWLAALASTGALLGLTLGICMPISLVLALILDQAAPRGADTRLLEGALAALSGVPSVVHGMVAVLLAGADPGVGISALTLATIVGPGLVVGVRRAFARSRQADRLAAQALGASAWQVLVFVVGPAAAPALIAAALRAGARVLGLAAPLLVLRGAAPGPLAVVATRDALVGAVASGAAQALILVMLVLVFHAVAAWLTRPMEAP